jgi:hypothetical protein
MSNRISTPVAVIGGLATAGAVFAGGAYLREKLAEAGAKAAQPESTERAESISLAADRLLSYIDRNKDGRAVIGKEIVPNGPGGAWLGTAMLADQILGAQHKGHLDNALDVWELGAVLEHYDTDSDRRISESEEQDFYATLLSSRD